MTAENAPQFCLFGAAPDTGNLGVSALCHSVVAGVTRAVPRARATVFDHGRGVRSSHVALDDHEYTMQLVGAYHTRRIHRPECLWQARVAGWLGWAGTRVNRVARIIRSSDAVLDISGGDSFSDIYGMHRFRSVCMGKLIALETGTPLVLLPQTYGPYASAEARDTARDIVRGATLAWARDLRSFESLRELLGDAFDPERHRSGVDVAFALPARRPENVPARLEEWWGNRSAGPVVGVNVSGLIHGSASAHSSLGLAVDYEDLIGRIVTGLVRDHGARVVLVPHVVGKGAETDVAACRRVADALSGECGENLLALDGEYDQFGAKWVISQLDFFCGTRMHSCIAGLSTGVPTVGLAYSKKTRGVFDSCGQGDAVPELRGETTDAVLEQFFAVWADRDHRREDLAARLLEVKGIAQEQLASIVRTIGRRPTPGGAW